MLIKYSGYLEASTQKYPYALIDTEETFVNMNVARTRLLTIPEGGVTATSNGSVLFTDKIIKVPNAWKDAGYPALSDVSINGSTGLIVSLDLLNGTRDAMNANGAFATNPSYNQFSAPNLAAVYFHFFDNIGGYGLNWNTTEYTDGILLEISINNGSYGSAKYFFTPDGAIYFVLNCTQRTPLFGFFPQNTRNYTGIGSLENLRMYCLRPFASTAQGNVTDKNGTVLANQSIMAFRRSTGKLVGKAMTDSSGNYTMPLSALKGEKLFMVCLDDDTAPDFEAVILDRVTV